MMNRYTAKNVQYQHFFMSTQHPRQCSNNGPCGANCDDLAIVFKFQCIGNYVVSQSKFATPDSDLQE